jgi:hypothetical protein
MYPECAEIDGKQYKIDTSYQTALKCFEVIDDDTITDYERGLAIIYLLFDFIPKKDLEKFLMKAKTFLECGREENEKADGKKDMDFVQDRKYINSSFMSDYHIDLSKEDLHFWQFVELIEGLTEQSSLNRIRDLRNYDVSQIKDQKERAKIEKAQRQVALKTKHSYILSDKQMENINKFYEQTGIKRKE